MHGTHLDVAEELSQEAGFQPPAPDFQQEPRRSPYGLEAG